MEEQKGTIDEGLVEAIAEADANADEAKPEEKKAAPLSKKVEKQRKAQEKQFKKMMDNFRANRVKANQTLKFRLDLLKRQLGKDDFNALKSICTVEVPEQKDADGKVIQEAKTVVNKQALLVEASHLLVLMREERMKKGLRKRTTGRSSDRKAHKSMLAFLTKRNKQSAAENVTAKVIAGKQG